jgi:hypothetical protein
MPLWAQNGRELFYLSMGALMSVPVTTGSTFTFGNPIKLFDFEYFRQAAGRTRRVAPWPTLCHDQAERRRSEPPPAARIVLIQNWFEELKRRVPTK